MLLLSVSGNVVLYFPANQVTIKICLLYLNSDLLQ